MKLINSFPGGSLLVPMFISAFIATFFPGLFNIGGVTEAFMSGSGLNYVLGATIFISGCGLNLSTIGKVLSRYAPILFFRTIIASLIGILFFKIFGIDGIFGISSIAFIVILLSLNPTLFLALVKDYGDSIDKDSFGFVSLFALPVIPMLVLGVISPSKVDLMPVISTLIPLVLGIIIGNIDKELGKFLSSGMPFIIFMLGWCIGASINLKEALRAGFSGVIMTLLYYMLTFLPLFVFEKVLIKREGISSSALSTMGGLSASVPFLVAASNPSLSQYASRSSSIITFGVVFTAIITPIISRHFAKKNEEEYKIT